MLRCFILLLYCYTVLGIGYDAGGSDRATCGRPYRAGRLYQPPCDLGTLGYCTQAGTLYPWRAVRKFVKDNQGLMRRMYGDQRHGHVLRSELEGIEDFEEEWEKRERENGGYGRWRPTPIRFARYQRDEYIDNELESEDFADQYEEEPRYLRGDLANDDVLNTKFVISEQEAAIAIKLAELKAAAHFRFRTQFKPPSTSTPKTTLTSSSTTKSTTKLKPINGTLVGNATTTTTTTTTMGPEMNEIIDKVVETTTVKQKNSSEAVTVDTTSVASTVTTTIDSLELSTTDTTTEEASKKTTFSVISEKLGEQDPEKETTSEKPLSDISESEEDGSDQSHESSEQSEIYADREEQGPVPPAVLFQDLEEDVTKKKKQPVDYNGVKGFNACPVKEEVVAPFWANNTRGETLALLNMYPFEQYVHWEKCTFEHRQMYCREGCRCEQQYRLHRLLAYDPNNECRGIFSDWFRFPSCCVCKCYDMPPEFRVTSRSPRFQVNYPEDEDIT
ncbi:protein spaetzle 4 isoform X2 [Anthonomus grandis grandis]|uniref:protein spaetzle 4 isoform X2 n=1 Tax=Anthonomus grandis grandis TaxID=2921223 RepID=UPI00216669BA|nr:protein spaetzle 4 isoform X2 [Anthonomus grandis grandis]